MDGRRELGGVTALASRQARRMSRDDSRALWLGFGDEEEGWALEMFHDRMVSGMVMAVWGEE